MKMSPEEIEQTLIQHRTEAHRLTNEQLAELISRSEPLAICEISHLIVMAYEQELIRRMMNQPEGV